MTLEGRSQHYGEFKRGKQRVVVATSAFGLGVDIDDISEVILFGLPDSGSELVQLAGRGERDPLRFALFGLWHTLRTVGCQCATTKL